MWQALLVTLISLVSSEYLPGTRPKSYTLHESISIFVINLDSDHTELPFDYYYLNFCKPKHIEEANENIGQILTGEVIESTPYKQNLNEIRHVNPFATII